MILGLLWTIVHVLSAIEYFILIAVEDYISISSSKLIANNLHNAYIKQLKREFRE